MVKGLTKLKAIRDNRHKERGNTMVMYIMLFPLVFGIFGVAVDTTVATYTQSSLQSNLDAATQSALSRATNPGTSANLANRPMLTSDQARNYIISIYDTNRTGTKEQPFVKCQSSVTQSSSVKYASPRLVTPPSGCKWTEGKYSFSNYQGQISVSMTLVESSSTVFSHIIGIKDFKYNISSDARISYVRG
jgi:Flp pilus assembly protein TadG